MAQTKHLNRHRLLSIWIITCSLLYIFAYQFKLPFAAEVFLYGIVAGLLAMTVFEGQVAMSKQVVLFILVAVSSLLGVSYTSMPVEGRREAILFTFFAGVFALSLANPSLIKQFTKWIYIISIVVVFSCVVQFIAPDWFSTLMKSVLREDAYSQFRWSYRIDDAYAGISAYTPNTTFSAAIVFGHSFLSLIRKDDKPLIKNRVVNMILMALAVFTIIMCSKRGIFVATALAMVVMMFQIYRGKNFFLKFLGVAAVGVVVMFVLAQTNAAVAAFLDRFVNGDVLTGRDEIYATLWKDYTEGSYFIGRGTGAAYRLADAGAHNIYLQILYDHGIFLSIPYYVLLLYNYRMAFKKKCPISIFVQTLFLVYGLSGNPLYSNMFMMIYIYYVLYAVTAPMPQENKKRRRRRYW